VPGSIPPRKPTSAAGGIPQSVTTLTRGGRAPTWTLDRARRVCSEARSATGLIRFMVSGRNSASRRASGVTAKAKQALNILANYPTLGVGNHHSRGFSER
jgi:hypothetical protein